MGLNKKEKKKLKWWQVPLVFLAGLLGFVLVFALVLFINGTCFRVSELPEEDSEDDYSRWMAELPDDMLLTDIIMPGSHDAGTAEMVWLGATQNVSVGMQLRYGARYFDIRVNKTEDGYRIYHSVLNGIDFCEVLTDICDFMVTHPTETLLLDFQHFSGDSGDDVYEMVKEQLDGRGLIAHSEDGVFPDWTLGDVRGKCIVFFGGIEQGEYGDWVFTRNNDECTRENCNLNSYYFGDNHKAGFSSLTEEAHPVYLQSMQEERNAGSNAIFVLQCQLTDGKLIFGPWSAERGQETEMSDYIQNLKDSEYFGLINVVLRDFLTPEKCREIIDLNQAKLNR